MLEGDVIEFEKSGVLVVVQRQLARGRFGLVFEVMDAAGTRFAIKESRVKTDRQLRQIEAEINTLSALNHLDINTPKLIDYRVHAVGNESYQSLILMTLQPGVPIDTCLPTFTGNQLDFAYSMIQQLAFTLKTLDRVCCHRDLNSHNILWEEKAGKFSIVDFGFALDKNDWWHYRWRDSAVAGDARYWPTCAWRMMLGGWTQMTPGGVEQYKEKLDMHSFTLTMIEIIASGPCPQGLHNAWTAYISDASRFTILFLKCSVDNGDWDALKQELTNLDVLKKTTQNLKQLKVELKAVRQLHPVFPIIERMLCINENNPTTNWSYISNSVPTASTKFSSDEFAHALRMHY